MSRWRVLIGSRSFGQAYPEHLHELSQAGCDVIQNSLGRAYRAEELFEALRGVHAIVTGTDELTRAVIEAAESLRVIAKHGVGVENIDGDAARERGIVVASTPGAMNEAVAELVFALMLALARRIPEADATTRLGEWRRLTGLELNGRTLGLVGFGRIAQTVCVRAQAFAMSVIAHDPFPDAAAARRLRVPLVSLQELLGRADVVSLHASVGPGALPLIGRDELRIMQPAALLVNTARGALVDEAALAEALGEGRLGGAGIDVFSSEPPADSPLFGLANVVVTPHLGGQTRDALRRMGEMTVANCLDGLRATATTAEHA